MVKFCPRRGFGAFPLIAILTCVLHHPASAQVSVANSFYVPQAGGTVTPIVGTTAARFFRACPNNDGNSSLPNRARIKIVLQNSSNVGVAGLIPYIKFNGGTPAQGFTGNGADSIIANSAYNYSPPCPDVRQISADGPTDGQGVTYLTFTGAGGTRDAARKWGHYDCEIPVYVLDGATEVKILGKLLESDPNTLQVTPPPACGAGTQTYGYVLQIKNFDSTGGLLGTHIVDDNVGERVDPGDFNVIANGIGATNVFTWWRDFDSVGGVHSSDFNMIWVHANHNCDTPTP